jgi:hypothetical protein
VSLPGGMIRSLHVPSIGFGFRRPLLTCRVWEPAQKPGLPCESFPGGIAECSLVLFVISSLLSSSLVRASVSPERFQVPPNVIRPFRRNMPPPCRMSPGVLDFWPGNNLEVGRCGRLHGLPAAQIPPGQMSSPLRESTAPSVVPLATHAVKVCPKSPETLTSKHRNCCPGEAHRGLSSSPCTLGFEVKETHSIHTESA